MLRGELSELITAAPDKRDYGPRQPNGFGGLGSNLNHQRVRVLGRSGPAQQAGIARFKAERRRIYRHVWARFVDDGDYAKWHSQLAQLQPTLELALFDQLADRIRQRSYVARAGSNRGNSILVQQQPVKQCCGEPGRLAGCEIERIGLNQFSRTGLQRDGKSFQGGVLRLARGACQERRGGLRLSAKRRDAGLFSCHQQRVVRNRCGRSA
uniref:Unannotated protein n=1 Tax=freshwater metagenome TaxID=449393 RepID=A0A6J5ZY82_9ZZZZ